MNKANRHPCVKGCRFFRITNKKAPHCKMRCLSVCHIITNLDFAGGGCVPAGNRRTHRNTRTGSASGAEAGHWRPAHSGRTWSGRCPAPLPIRPDFYAPLYAAGAAALDNAGSFVLCLAEKGLQRRAFGMIEQIVRGAAFGNHAVCHKEHLVRHMAGKFHLMGHHDHGAVAGF